MDCKIKIDAKIENEFIKKKLIVNGLQEKIAIFILGGPGSGKTSVLKIILKNLKKKYSNFVNINIDNIISDLYSNNISCYNKPAYILNSKIFNLAIKKNYNIIIDETGKDFNNTIKKIKLLHKNNYIINLVIVYNNIDIALQRIYKRYKIEKRNVDVDFTKYSYKLLKLSIPKYLDLKCDLINGSTYLIDNTKKFSIVYNTYCDSNIKKLKCVLYDC